MKTTHQQSVQQATSNEFQTRDIYLASTIKQAGVPIIRVEGNGGRGIFVFRNSEKIEKIIADYFKSLTGNHYVYQNN